MCGYIHNSHPPALADINTSHLFHREDGRKRMSDLAMNLLYVIGFLSYGNGGTEAGGVLGLLGLLNDTTMERRSFTTIEERIAPSSKGLTKDILLENLMEEVRLIVQELNDFDIWKQSLDGSIVLDKSKYPRLCVSFEMAWQQRNSGNRYASQSGHALFVGGFTRKPIAVIIKIKLCYFCKAWKKKPINADFDPPEHTCYFNHNTTLTFTLQNTPATSITTNPLAPWSTGAFNEMTSL
jgi:hypothetical protein